MELQSPRLTPQQKIALVIVIALSGLVFLYIVRSILPPFVLAVIAAYVLNPVVNWLKDRTRLPRGLVVTAVYLAVLAIVGWGLITFIFPIIRIEITELARTLPSLIRSLQRELQTYQPLASLGIRLDPALISGEIIQAVRSLLGRTPEVVAGTIDVFAHLLIFLVATFYLLIDGQRFVDAVCRLIPSSYRMEMYELGSEVNYVLGQYIRGQLFLVVLMSTLSWIALAPILHLQFALIISLATGVLELFPWVGPISAGAIAGTVAFVQHNPFGWPSWVYALAVIGVYIALRNMEDYLVVPNIIGRAVRLHPLVVMFVLFAGATLGGLLGLFIAVPATASLKIILSYVYRKLVEGPDISISPS
ncbi:MAG: AI-2E family transporter [Bacteroidetes bacterium]|nr:AI-2E family transporter [Bacteroidota bacterium]MCL5026287.1 AI-2E family transporter [Chloroflexota bacterium]